MYFTLHRVHLTNKSLAIGQNCKMFVKNYMEKHIPILSWKWWLLVIVSHLKRSFRSIKCLICQVLSLVSPSKKHQYSVKWVTRFTVVVFSVAFFFLWCFHLQSIAICCQNTLITSATSNQNNKLFRWIETTRQSINPCGFFEEYHFWICLQ